MKLSQTEAQYKRALSRQTPTPVGTAARFPSSHTITLEEPTLDSLLAEAKNEVGNLSVKEKRATEINERLFYWFGAYLSIST